MPLPLLLYKFTIHPADHSSLPSHQRLFQPPIPFPRPLKLKRHTIHLRPKLVPEPEQLVVARLMALELPQEAQETRAPGLPRGRFIRPTRKVVVVEVTVAVATAVILAKAKQLLLSLLVRPLGY